MRLIRYPWFPFAFALGFPLTVYLHNQAAFAGIEVLRPAALFLVITAALLFVLRRVLADSVLASVLSTIPLVCIWLLGLSWPAYLVLALWLCSVVVLRNRQLPENVAPVLNALAIGVLLPPIIGIAKVEMTTLDESLQSVPFSPFSSLAEISLRADLPDIYHIVLDAYAGADSLAGELGFDNSAFYEQLRNLGFAVSESIIAPYNETVHTMSSIFLGAYLRPGEFPVASTSSFELRSTLGALIPNGPVQDILRDHGYTLIYTDPGHTFLRFPDDATMVRFGYSGPLTMFELHLGRVAGLEQWLPQLFEVSDEDPLILSVQNALSQDYTSFDSPKFVYQHMMAPHTPFIVDRNGVKTTDFPDFTTTSEGDIVVMDDPAKRRAYVRGYLEKLRYINDHLVDQLSRLRDLPGKKIIVVHGDHGSGSRYFLNDRDKTCLRERFTTLLAVYADDPRTRDEFGWVEDADASLVNVYRSTFNALAGLDLELLNSRSHFVPFIEPYRIMPLDRDRIREACDPA